MARRRIWWLWVLLLGLVAGWLAPVGADEQQKAEAQRPTAAKPDDNYELFSVLVDTLDQVERNYVKTISRRELIEAAIQGVLNKLDPYSNYITPDELTKFRTSVESQFGGIGIQITMDRGHLKVLSPLAGSPAYREGVQAGDQITEIEGVSTEGISIEQAVQKLKGDVGTKVSITILHPLTTEPKKVTITREVIHLETVLGDKHLANDTWDYFLDRDRRIAYIRLTAFSRDTAGELRTVLADLKKQGLRGLVLDLRFNPGGLLNSAIDVSDLFISEGRIVSTEGRNSEPRFWDAHPADTFEGFPMAVIVNRFSASSSEIVAACLQDHQRAVIIGERTWGKGSVQNVVELEGGRSALKLTTASYKRPSGKNIHKFPDATDADEWGVVPNPGFEVKLSTDEMRELIAYRRDRDILPARALEHGPEKGQAATPGDKPAAKEPADAGKDAGKSESGQTEAPAKEEGKPAGEKPAGEAPAAEDPGAKKPADEKPADQPSSVDRPAGEPPADKAPEKPEEDASSLDHAPTDFVDRQLQKALDYLSAELVKAP